MSWIHRLLKVECPTCDVLKMELEKAQREKEKLLAALLYKEPDPAPTEFKQMPQRTSWPQRRAALERQSHQVLVDQEKKTAERIVEELEKETGIA